MTTRTLRLHALAALARAYADQAEARSLADSRSAHHAAAHGAPHAPLLARRAEKSRTTARHRARRAEALESRLTDPAVSEMFGRALTEAL
jgi:hypothetical protein